MASLGSTIGEILPFAVALAVGPLPIVSVMLILASNDARPKGISFVGGRLAGLSLIVGVSLAVFSVIDDPKLGHADHPSPAVSIGRLVVGVILVGLAARMWLRRNVEADGPSPIVRRVDGLSVKGAFGMGIAISVIDPASISLGVLVGLDIAGTRLPVATAVLVAVAFVLVSTVTVTGPLLAYLAGGDAARRRLADLKVWLVANERTVMMVLLLLIGAILIGRGIRELAG